MYAAVGKFEGSHPMFISSGSWYTRIQSIFMVAGKVRWSRST